MKKICGVLFGIFLSTQVYGFGVNLVTELIGQSRPAGKIYVPLPGKAFEEVSLVAGLSAAIPADKDKELDAQVLIGVSTPVPLIGIADWYLSFENANGMTPNTRPGGDFYCKSLSLSKSILYPLTDKIELGVNMVLLSVALDGTKVVYVMQSVAPAIGLRVNF